MRARCWFLHALLSCALACSNAGPVAPAQRSQTRESSSHREQVQHAAQAGPASPADAALAERAARLESGRPALPLAARTPLARPPEHGCALGAAQELGAGERGFALYLGTTPGVLAVGADGRELTLWLPTGTRFAAGPRHTLEAALARASLLCTESCELALVDVRGKLLSVGFDTAAFGTPRPLASGADRRFAPALGRLGPRFLYAYTASVDEAMHTLLAERRGDEVAVARDLTPPGHGAAAPTFVLGASAPILVAIDARAGMSPLLEWTFDGAGSPSAASVRTPVSQPYAPPLLAAVQSGAGEVDVAYTAVGRAAMTAVGRVPLRRASEPVALQPSSGYGELAFSAARGRRRALFVLEVPDAPAPNAPRHLALKLFGDGQSYDGPSITPGEAGARRPSAASGPSPGDFLLAYTRGTTVVAVPAVCDD